MASSTKSIETKSIMTEIPLISSQNIFVSSTSPKLEMILPNYPVLAPQGYEAWLKIAANTHLYFEDGQEQLRRFPTDCKITLRAEKWLWDSPGPGYNVGVRALTHWASIVFIDMGNPAPNKDQPSNPITKH